MARPMPVLPDVPSMMVLPGFRRPSRSASSIIRTAMRSLIELPGLNVSTFASTVAGIRPRVILLIRMSGVSPMASRTVSQIFFFTLLVYIAARQGRSQRQADRNRRGRDAPEAESGVGRPGQLRPCAGQRCAYGGAGGMAGTGAAAGVRGNYGRAPGDDARRAP